jgi:6-phosphogluconolactonase
VPVSPEKIHRLKGELPPAQAVAEANAAIGKLLPKNPNGVPVFDLIFLGLGENAHIASLMPEIPAAVANSQAAYVVIENSPKPPPTRLSLTYAAIAAAKNVWMLASGKGKEEALRDSLKADSTTPFGRVLQSRANTVIYTDIKL